MIMNAKKIKNSSDHQKAHKERAQFLFFKKKKKNVLELNEAGASDDQLIKLVWPYNN